MACFQKRPMSRGMPRVHTCLLSTEIAYMQDLAFLGCMKRWQALDGMTMNAAGGGTRAMSTLATSTSMTMRQTA